MRFATSNEIKLHQKRLKVEHYERKFGKGSSAPVYKKAVKEFNEQLEITNKENKTLGYGEFKK